MKSKIPVLTSLRFFAAASIVYYHCLGHVTAVPNSTWALGVSFFFVLSGFILTYAHDGLSGRGTAKFYLNRFARIWPVHIVTLVAAILLAHVEYPDSAIDLSLLIENLLLVHAWPASVQSVFSYNAVSWSLSVEVTFYLLFPLIVRVRHLEIVWVVTLAVALSGVAVASQTLPKIPTDPSEPGWMLFVLQNPIARLPEFIIGMIAARWSGLPRRGNGAAWATILELVALALLAIFLASSPLNMALRPRISEPFDQWAQQSGGMLFFAAVIFVFARQEGVISRALSWSPLVLLGEISFCTYMIHHLILRCVAAADIPFDGYTFAIIIPVIYVTSYLMWRYLEKPCRAWITSWGAGGRKSLVSLEDA